MCNRNLNIQKSLKNDLRVSRLIVMYMRFDSQRHTLRSAGRRGSQHPSFNRLCLLGNLIEARGALKDDPQDPQLLKNSSRF